MTFAAADPRIVSGKAEPIAFSMLLSTSLPSPVAFPVVRLTFTHCGADP